MTPSEPTVPDIGPVETQPGDIRIISPVTSASWTAAGGG